MISRVVAPDLAAAGCAVAGTTFYGSVRVRNVRPSLSGALRAKTLRCVDGSVTAVAPQIALDLSLSGIEIMAVVDHTGNQLTRARVSEFVSLTGSKVHLVYLAPEHVLSAEVSQTDKAIDPTHVANLQQYVNEVNAQGVPAEGQILTSTLFGRGKAVVDLAEQLRCDLIILNTEEGGQRAKAELAQAVASQNPKMAVLIARSTQ